MDMREVGGVVLLPKARLSEKTQTPAKNQAQSSGIRLIPAYQLTRSATQESKRAL